MTTSTPAKSDAGEGLGPASESALLEAAEAMARLTEDTSPELERNFS